MNLCVGVDKIIQYVHCREDQLELLVHQLLHLKTTHKIILDQDLLSLM